MTKKGFLAGLFLLGIWVTAFAKSNETVKRESGVNCVSIDNNISEGIKSVGQSGGGNNTGTVLIPIKPPKPPVIIN